MNKHQLDLIYLMRCALNEKIPEMEMIKTMDLEQIYKLSKKHSVSAMVYFALESANTFSQFNENRKLEEKWKETKEKAVRKNILLKTERRAVFQYMNQNRIWHMALKGAVIESMYPKFGMREMADQDILYDSAYQRQLCEWMKKRGYTVVSVGKGNHDIYEKPPVYNFEMHTSLISEMYRTEWKEYYREVKKRLIRDASNPYEYHFSDEDFYVYMIVHACKHFMLAGTGLRTLSDIYIYLHQKENKMDWAYMKHEMKILKIESFEHEIRVLSKKLFSGDSVILTPAEEKQLSYLFDSGTYGTQENYIENSLKEIRSETSTVGQAKLQYIWKRLILSEREMKAYHPIVYQHRYLLPFLVIYRVVRGILFKRKKIKKEFEAMRKLK